MTIETIINRASYTGNGTTTGFSFPYLFFANTDLIVIKRDSTGNETIQTLNSDYTVTGAGNENGGTVTFTAAPAGTEQVIILREVPYDQQLDYPSNNKFPSASHEEGLDRAAMRDQQLLETIGRCLKFPKSDANTSQVASSIERASKILSFDADGNPSLTDPSTLGGGGNLLDPAVAQITPTKGDKAVLIADIVAPRYRLDNYEGFTGNGTTSDQVAWDSMMQDIVDNGGDAVIEGDPSWDVRITTNNIYSGLRNVHFDGRGMRMINGNSLNGIIQMDYCDHLSFDNIIFDGLSRTKISSITVSAGVATVTTETAHEFTTGQRVGIRDVKSTSGNYIQDLWDSAMNGRHQVTVTGANTFTFTAPSNVSASFDATYAEVNKGSKAFGQDGLRLRRCTNIRVTNCTFKNVRDAAWRITSLTDGGAIASNPTLPVAVSEIFIHANSIVNCGQSSMTPGGGTRIVQTNNIYYMMFGGGPKVASRMRDAVSVIFNNNIIDTGIDLAPVSYFAASGIILEGVREYTINNNVIRDLSGLGIYTTPNDADAVRLTRFDAQRGTIIGNVIYDNVSAYNSREQHGIRIDTGPYTTSSIPLDNIEIAGNVIVKVSGHGIYFANGTGHFDRVNCRNNIFAECWLNSICLRPLTAENIDVSGNVCTRENNTLPAWTSGPYNQFDIIKTSGGRAYRLQTVGGGNSTVEPDLDGTRTYSDGYTWKWLTNLHEIFVGNPETAAGTDSIKYANVTNNVCFNNPDGDGIEVAKGKYIKVASNFLTENFGYGISFLNSEEVTFQSNFIVSNGRAGFNFANSENIYFKDNIIDMDGIAASGILGSNTTGIFISGNIIRNIASGVGHGINFSEGSDIQKLYVTPDNVFQNVASQIRFLFEAYEDLNLTEGRVEIVRAGAAFTGTMAKGSTFQNTNANIGQRHLEVCTTAGFLTTNDFSLITNTGPIGTQSNWYFDANSKVWRVVADNGAASPTVGASEFASDVWGIVDGGNNAINAHWKRKSPNDFGVALWTSGETGLVKFDQRVSGITINSLTHSGGVATAVCSEAHGLSTGDVITISRALPSDYNKIEAEVTVVNSTTFRYNMNPSASTTASTNPDFANMLAVYGTYEMMAPGTRTSGTSRPTALGAANGDYFFEYWGPKAVIATPSTNGLLVAV